ncbi:nuclear cap-binding protein subunit 3-like [Euwallacea fornicatus]|uniref:nuclear cap-binding protein subunit 3-like n=1 Tax=Euwallacea fornicatus TaxID=995702 RepID=UPI00338F6F07
MSTITDASSRPNIRIEITNSAQTERQGAPEEKMDIDADENEEGEIRDDVMDLESSPHETRNHEEISRNAIFTTGINIFDKKEQEKLQERAKRFALKPAEIHMFSDQDLQDLRESLGITSTNESDFKFDTVHLLGLEEMTTEDIIEYFSSYAPEGIEWIDNNTCNVVWLDSMSAARALHFKSRMVRGMPAREPKDTFPKEFLDDSEETHEETGQSILLKNKNREIELQNEVGQVILLKKKTYPENSVDISEITIPIPPGYWRLGNSHPNTKCLLIRFGKVIDKLPFKSEKCSKYYKKFPNSQGNRHVISETRKKELRSIFERNKELNQSKNPWGSLAQNWDQDSKYREKEPIMYQKDKEDDEVQIVAVKNPKLQARLGTKRKLESDAEKSDNDNESSESNTKNPKIAVERKGITKVPRMKMYADEEEENQKRRKLLLSIKKQNEELDKKEMDLRNMLGPTSRFLIKDDFPEIEPSIDLASKLKNRNKKMVYAVEADPVEFDPYFVDRSGSARILYPDVRTELIERSRRKESDVTRTIFIQPKRDVRDRLAAGGHSNRERPHSRRTSRRSPEMTLHSDRIPANRSDHSRRRRRSYSPENRRRGEIGKSRTSAASRSPRKPTVASTIWSKVTKNTPEKSSSESDSSESESSSEESSSSSDRSVSEDSDAESDSSGRSAMRIKARNPDRPGFDRSRLSHKVDHKSPLKITTANEHFKQRK